MIVAVVSTWRESYTFVFETEEEAVRYKVAVEADDGSATVSIETVPVCVDASEALDAWYHR